nr:PREDICTED: uncharacterized protein LOC109040687 [Bemisia tabaci]
MSYRGASMGQHEVETDVQNLREQLEQMRSLVNDHAHILEGSEKGKKKKANQDSIINGSFLSFMFLTVFMMIMGVSIYAFKSLFAAIIKKFNHTHTEL